MLGLVQKYTPADILMQYVLQDAELCYHQLIKKYPEYTWTNKYVKRGLSYVIPEFSLLTCYNHFNLFAFWCDDAIISDCKKILKLGLPINTSIRLKSGERHTILLIGYDEERKLFYAHDPLGDYFSNYKIMYGANIEFPFYKILKISTGNPLRIQLSCNSYQSELVSEILHLRKLYSWP
ncbi:hypothetical protein [Acaryochloris marina]|uniref:hypothetical protein n=1 Tax=Acaryochloris marina TaxID=155978 RepID=UPI001BAFCFEA|nr:hypothetical protein [Acaryochloris marina]QUY46298.1 hypothetical protein I1H34_31865 [Acaryochloris marina S15]